MRTRGIDDGAGKDVEYEIVGTRTGELVVLGHGLHIPGTLRSTTGVPVDRDDILVGYAGQRTAGVQRGGATTDVERRSSTVEN